MHLETFSLNMTRWKHFAHTAYRYNQLATGKLINKPNTLTFSTFKAVKIISHLLQALSLFSAAVNKDSILLMHSLTDSEMTSHPGAMDHDLMQNRKSSSAEASNTNHAGQYIYKYITLPSIKQSNSSS